MPSAFNRFTSNITTEKTEIIQKNRNFCFFMKSSDETKNLIFRFSVLFRFFRCSSHFTINLKTQKLKNLKTQKWKPSTKFSFSMVT